MLIVCLLGLSVALNIPTVPACSSDTLTVHSSTVLECHATYTGYDIPPCHSMQTQGTSISPSNNAYYAHSDLSRITKALWEILVFSHGDGTIILHMIT